MSERKSATIRRIDKLEPIEGAEDKSQIADTEREGVVFKCIEQPDISFKAISNRYLLKHGD